MTPEHDFGPLLRAHRRDRGLTQQELADAAGVSVRAISDMERGIARNPQRRTVEALAGPLGLADAELVPFLAAARRSRPGPAPRPPVFTGAATGALPPDLHDLVGRRDVLADLLDAAGEAASGRRHTGSVVVLGGSPGTGKTSLAVHAAHRMAALFPDGPLFLKLRGMSADPARPADVLYLVLRALGVDVVRIPSDEEQRTALCRWLLRDRAALIVLDDAADEAQVRPLLVGGRRCLTLVTGRRLLVGLVGVRRHVLDVLGTDDAVALLAGIAGADRVAAQRAEADELVELCGRLPFALRIAGNRLASRPQWHVGRLVGQLRTRRLTGLTAGDLDVRGVFELSYRQLGPAATTAFRRLSLVPGADFSAGAVAALTGARDEDEATAVLEGLADASLLQPAQQEGRYQFHHLLHVFAAERLARDETPREVRDAEQRLARWLVHTATRAGGHFQPSWETREPPACPWYADHVGAARWLEAESANWLPAVRSTAARGGHREVVDLTAAMRWYPEFGGTSALWHEVFRLGLDAALALGCKHAEAVQRNLMSWTQLNILGRKGDAVRMAGRAWEAAVAAGCLREQGWARMHLANSSRRTDLRAAHALFDEALDLFDRADFPLGLHVARAHRAGVLHLGGRFDEAAGEFATCVDYFREEPGTRATPVDTNMRAYLLLWSAQNLAALGSTDLALRQCEESLELFRANGAAMGHARASQFCGVLLRGRDEPDRAHARLTSALSLFERIGQPRKQIGALRELASLAAESGDLATARVHRERALSLCADLHDEQA